MPAAPPLLGSTGSTTFVLVVVLVALGVAMAIAAVWLTRATRTDTPALGPLEVMGDRRFARRDPAARTAVLAGARPEGAPDPAPMVDIEDEPAAVEPEPAEALVPHTADDEPSSNGPADEPEEPDEPDEPAEAAQQAH